MLEKKLLDEALSIGIPNLHESGEQHSLFLAMVAAIDEYPQECDDVRPVLRRDKLAPSDPRTQRFEDLEHPQHVYVLGAKIARSARDRPLNGRFRVGGSRSASCRGNHYLPP
jgi:hypothetical protein